MRNGNQDADGAAFEPTLGEIIRNRYSRRAALQGAAVVGAGLALSACDSGGGGSSTPTPPPTDNPPTVTASLSGTVAAGNLVTMTGTASDDMAVASTAWRQVSGTPTLSLSSTTALTTQFTIPNVAATTNFVFEFSATDSKGQVSTAQVTVTVNPATLSFAAVPKSTADMVTVPAGYQVTVVLRRGDWLTVDYVKPANDFKNDGTDADDVDTLYYVGYRCGDHCNSAVFLPANSDGEYLAGASNDGRLYVMHDEISQQYLYPNGPTTMTAAQRSTAEAVREIDQLGLSMARITQTGGTWKRATVKGNGPDGIHLSINTLQGTIKGPAAGTAQMTTKGGTGTRGAVGPRAAAISPWQTVLAGEGVCAQFFRRPVADNAARTAKEVTALTRYGLTNAMDKYRWTTAQTVAKDNYIIDHWTAAATGASAANDYRNEPNRIGWIAEVVATGLSPDIRKRTALGRMNHSGCQPGPMVEGRKPAFYLSDDGEGEYIYKFVSNTAWVAADGNPAGAARNTLGDKYLDAGTLYVAKFNADGTGQWLPLVYGTAPLTSANTSYSFASQADVLINARVAGDALGATPMDRPCGVAVNPANGEVYVGLTNSRSRTAATTNPSNPRAYRDSRTGVTGNPDGHIVRFRETGDTTEATSFTWDVYAFGASSDLASADINVSGLTANNSFSGPVGLAFGRPNNVTGFGSPVLWIQTGDDIGSGGTNNQLLAAVPGRVGDGGARTINNGTGTQATRVGVAPAANTLRRFLTGPVECDIRGVDSTPDGKTLFVTVQHPGLTGDVNAPNSHWPDSQATGTAGATVRPRSAVIAITRTDGGYIGL